jgi:glycerol-3-phosphate dehydrogenase
LQGFSGIGDLIVTCTSMHSRNRRAGIQIGQGKPLDEVLGGTRMVVEGVKATQAAYELSVLHGIDMPITRRFTGFCSKGPMLKSRWKIYAKDQNARNRRDSGRMVEKQITGHRCQFVVGSS